MLTEKRVSGAIVNTAELVEYRIHKVIEPEFTELENSHNELRKFAVFSNPENSIIQ